MFFSFEGTDGAGKSTQIDLFCQWLQQAGHTVARCRDPGTTPLGEKMRGVLLDPSTGQLSPRGEMLLYMAARAQLVAEVIRPAAEAGRVVVSDRFLLSNVVYQGHAGGVPPDEIWRLGRETTGGLLPDLSIVLDISPEAAARRMNRQLDRMEQRGLAFQQALRQGFLAEAARDPEHIVVIDADRPIDVVQADIRAAATQFLTPSS